MTFQRIAVVGAGAWGTALANCAARAGRDVTLWVRDAAMVAQLTATRENPRLPGIRLDERIAATGAIVDVAQADAVLLAVPAQDSRTAATALAPHLRPGAPIIACAKGIERGTHRFMTEIIAEALPGALPAILSGPSFASGDARLRGRRSCRGACPRSWLAGLPALPHDRRARRRDRRRGEKRAGDRGRHRAGPQARRERDSRSHHARICGAGALRTRARRAWRDADR